MMDSVRMDKFLWAVRLQRTRPEAADACRLGRVQMGGQVVKAGREVRVGDVIAVQRGDDVKTVKVLALIDKRVGGKWAADCLEDVTPEEEREKARLRREARALQTAAGPVLRPSKRDRRAMEAFLEEVQQGEGGVEED